MQLSDGLEVRRDLDVADVALRETVDEVAVGQRLVAELALAGEIPPVVHEDRRIGQDLAVLDVRHLAPRIVVPGQQRAVESDDRALPNLGSGDLLTERLYCI